VSTITIPLTQFILPDGRQSDTFCDGLPADLQSQYDLIRENGCRLTCEILTTGDISLAVEHKDGDFDIEIATNGPGEKSPKKSLERLIRRFNVDAFEKWLESIAA
jgi:hypothetical protein